MQGSGKSWNQRGLLRVWGLLAAFCCLGVWPACAAPGVPWLREQYPYRISVTLPALAVERNDAPVFLYLDDLSHAISAGKCLVVEQSGSAAVDVPSVAYAQPDGTERTLCWVASGKTPAQTPRTFHVYYEKGTDFPGWTPPPADSTVYSETVAGSRTYFELNLGKLSLRRAKTNSPALLYGEDPRYSHFLNLADTPSFVPGCGFRETWMFKNYPDEINSRDVPLEGVCVDWAPGQAALSFTLAGDTPLPHRTRITHRLFAGQIFSEYVFTQEALDGSVLEHAAGGKYLYWSLDACLDRIVTNSLPEAPLPDPDLYTEDVRWAVVSDAATGNAIGTLSPREAIIRANVISGEGGRVYDRGPRSSVGTHVRLYHGIGRKADLVAVFQHLEAGVAIGAVETPDYQVELPTPGAIYRAGDTGEIRITGSELRDLTASLIRPDLQSIPLPLVESEPGVLVASEPLVVTDATPTGKWQLAVSSPVKSAVVDFEVVSTAAGSLDEFWARTEYTHRIRVTLPAIGRDRIDAPVFVPLDGFEEPISGIRHVVVDQAGGNVRVMDSCAYAQPGTGEGRTLYFKASGVTPALAKRSFHIYFSPDRDLPSWTYSAEGIGQVETSTTGGTTSRTYYQILSNRIQMQRAELDAVHSLYTENPAYSYFRNGADLSGFDPGSGFREDWAFTLDPAQTFVSRDLVLEQVDQDNRGCQVAASFSVLDATVQPHRTRITHRLFQDQPICEYWLTQEALAGQALEHASGNKSLYWTPADAGFDRMWTDLGGDAALVAGDASFDTERYALAYDSSTGNALGMIGMQERTQIRVASNRVYARSPISSDGTSVRVIVAEGRLADLQALFLSLAAGIQAAEVEVPDYQVALPREDAYFYDGQAIQAQVRGSDFRGLVAHYIRPDQSTLDIAWESDADGFLIIQDPVVVDASTPTGIWQIVFSSPLKTVTRSVTVLRLAPAADAWTFPTRAFRREVTLPADPARARTNVPLFLDLSRIPDADLDSIRVDAVEGRVPLPLNAAVYAQPSGLAPRAFWVAAGDIPAGAVRRFLVYYNKNGGLKPYAWDWDRDSAHFATRHVTTSGPVGSERYTHLLEGNPLEFQLMARNPQGGTAADPFHAAFYDKDMPDKDVIRLENRTTGFSPLAGLRFSYSLWGGTSEEVVTFNEPGSEKICDDVVYDRNGSTAGFCARYTVAAPQTHRTDAGYRLFEGLPLLEFTLSSQLEDGTPAEFSSDVYTAREFYHADTFRPDAMTITNQSDAPLSDLALPTQWVVEYDGSKSNPDAVGLFSFTPSSMTPDTDKQSVKDTYQMSSRGGAYSLYYMTGPLQDILSAFRAMQQGYPVGPEQEPCFSITSPEPGAHYLPGESLVVVVEGARIGDDLQLTADFPDGTQGVYSPAVPGEPYNVFSLGAVSSKAARQGTWKLTATSGGVSRSITVEVRAPAHPRVLFTAAELTEKRAAWDADARFNGISQNLIDSCAEAYAAGAAPEILDGVAPRDYSFALLDYASLLLRYPDAPAYAPYRARMWADFDRIIRWKEWDPLGNAAAYFQLDEKLRGELMTALLLVYDWHYGDLTVVQQREYAELLARHADTLVDLGYVQHYPPTYLTFYTTRNDKWMNRNAALAGVARCLEGEIPAARRACWTAALEKTWANLQGTLQPDGTDHGGMSYYNRTNIAQFLWAETRRLEGRDDAYSHPWYQNAPLCELYSMQPGRVGNFGGILAFGDASNIPFSSHRMTMGLLGARLGNPYAQWISEYSDYARKEAYQLIWQTYETAPRDPSTLPNWHVFPDTGLFVFRSSWQNDALYFAGKCGSFQGGHEHPDLGSFVLHRNGYPYLTVSYYLLGATREDENVLLSNGVGMRGFNPLAVTEGLPPAQWGRLERAVGSPEAFQLLMDPTPAYEPAACVTRHRREFVGFGDLVVLRDDVATSGPADLTLLFHSFHSDPQTDPAIPYDYSQYPSEPVFEPQPSGDIRVYPNKAASPAERLTMLDLSQSAWTDEIAPAVVIPGEVPGYVAPGEERASNDAKKAYERGFVLKKRQSVAAGARSLQLLHFRTDPAFHAVAWDGAAAEDGLLCYQSDPANVLLKLVWPRGGALDGSNGLTVRGALAWSSAESELFGGRDLTLLRDDGVGGFDLLAADRAVTLVSETRKGRRAWIACDAPAQMTLHHPLPVRSVCFEGKPVAFSYADGQLHCLVPASTGGELLTSDDLPTARAAHWRNY